MLIGGVVWNDLHNNLQTPFMGLFNQLFEVIQVAVSWKYATIITHIITIIAQWRGHDRQKPDRVYPQILDVVQFGRQARQIAPAISV